MIKIEKFVTIEGFYDCYSVSNKGRVKNNRTGYILKNTLGADGYLSVLLSKNSKKARVRIHTLVANAFLLKDDNRKFVNHIDGDKTNNDVSNLEWCNRSENMVHALENNLITTKYSNKEIEVFTVRGDFVGRYESVSKCCEILNLNKSPVYRVIKGKARYHKNFVFKIV